MLCKAKLVTKRQVLYDSALYEVPGVFKFIQKESEAVVVNARVRGNGELVFHKDKVSVLQDMDGGNGCTTV